MTLSLESHLKSAGQSVCRFLAVHLPPVGGEGWWQTHVITQLTFGQQGQVRAKGISTLGALDLAALLRVFDRNWAELSHAAKLPGELRTHLRELLDLRHLAAHHAADGSGFDAGDLFRHLDTISRVIRGIDGNPASAERVEKARLEVLAALASDLLPSRQDSPVKVDEEPPLPTPPSPAGAGAGGPPGKGLAVGSFFLHGPGESLATEISSFNGRPVPATAIPWRVSGQGGIEFELQVVLIDEGGTGEFGQVICQSRLGSAQGWDDVVSRLRIGIRRLEDGDLIMDLRSAVRSGGSRATRNVRSFDEFAAATGCLLPEELLRLGAKAVGTRQVLTGDSGRTRAWPAVIFSPDDVVTPAASWILTTLQPLA